MARKPQKYPSAAFENAVGFKMSCWYQAVREILPLGALTVISGIALGAGGIWLFADDFNEASGVKAGVIPQHVYKLRNYVEAQSFCKGLGGRLAESRDELLQVRNSGNVTVDRNLEARRGVLWLISSVSTGFNNNVLGLSLGTSYSAQLITKGTSGIPACIADGPE